MPRLARWALVLIIDSFVSFVSFVSRLFLASLAVKL